VVKAGGKCGRTEFLGSKFVGDCSAAPMLLILAECCSAVSYVEEVEPALAVFLL